MTENNFTYSIKTPHGGSRELAFHSAQMPQPGQIIRLAGQNGAGKTTLLQLLAGLLPPTTGQVNLTKNDLFFLPHLPGLRRTLTTWENLDYWTALSNLKVKHYTKELEEIIEIIELKNILHVSLYKLSAGQQRRAALLRLAMMKTKKIWLLDEPETSLDQTTIQKLGQIITSYAASGGSVIWASHQILPTRIDGEIIL